MRTVIALVILFLLSGCSSLFKPTGTLPDEDLHVAALMASEKKYSEAVKLYGKIMTEAPQTAAAREALFRTACLHLYPDNPRKDYALALKGFEEYVKRYPGGEHAMDAENWKSVLKTVMDLKKENEYLHKSIEELNKLDIRHEEKRGRK